MRFEEYLQDIHGEDYHGTGDDMPEGFESWLVDLQVDDIIAYAEAWHKSELSKAGTKGGKARHEKLSPERRKEIAKMGGLAKSKLVQK